MRFLTKLKNKKTHTLDCLVSAKSFNSFVTSVNITEFDLWNQNIEIISLLSFFFMKTILHLGLEVTWSLEGTDAHAH